VEDCVNAVGVDLNTASAPLLARVSGLSGSVAKNVVQWRETHGMGDQDTCQTCHPADFCAKCHGVPVPHPIDFGASHGQAAIENPSACLTCHKSEETFCDTCHGTEMPHPADYIQAHVTIAQGDSDPRCIRCHVQSDCSACHALHTHPGGASGVPVPWTDTPEGRRP